MNKSINTDNTILPDDSDSRADLAPGTRLGRYEIIKLLGRGGMGQVYLVRHEMQETLHALKILPQRFSKQPSFVDRFRRELQTMARLQHPHIVHVTHSDEEKGVFYLVMDFIGADGTEEPYDLEEALAEETQFSAGITRQLMLQVCEGLEFAHQNGVVHRDLKPANILLTSQDLENATARVADFGLARVLGEEQVRTMVAHSVQTSMSMGDSKTLVEKKRTERSSTGAVLGTYGYMSPEQEEGKPADERSDIYALGVMMYRMLTGRRLRGRAKAASQLVEGLNPAWDDIIDKCLEIDPSDRWQGVAELRLAIDSIATKGHKPAFFSRPTRGVYRKVGKENRSGSLIGKLAVFLVILALLGAGGWWFMQQKPTEPSVISKPAVSDQTTVNNNDEPNEPKQESNSIKKAENVDARDDLNGQLEEVDPGSTANSEDEMETTNNQNETTLEVDFEIIPSKAVYYKGDEIKFRLRANQACHVAIIDNFSDGIRALLFPNNYSRDTLIDGGRDYIITGGEEDGFGFFVSPPFGTDQIKIIACREETEFHNKVNALVVGGGDEYVGILDNVATRELEALQKKMNVSDFREGDYVEKTVIMQTADKR